MLPSTMETQMLTQFKQALDQMSDEEFMTMWDDIKAEGGEGPTAAEFLLAAQHEPAARMIVSFRVAMPTLTTSLVGEPMEVNYSMAA